MRTTVNIENRHHPPPKRTHYRMVRLKGIMKPLCLRKNDEYKLWLTTNRNKVTCQVCLRKIAILDIVCPVLTMPGLSFKKPKRKVKVEPEIKGESNDRPTA